MSSSGNLGETINLKPIGLLWKLIFDESKEGFLLGTIHNVPSALLNINSEIQHCFDNSKLVGVEIIASNKERELIKNKEIELQLQEISDLNKMQKQNLRLFLQESLGYNEWRNERDELVILMALGRIKESLWKEMELVPGHDDFFIRQAYTKSKPTESLETFDNHLLGLGERIISRQDLATIADAYPNESKQALENIKVAFINNMKNATEVWTSGNIENLANLTKYPQAHKKRCHPMAEKIDKLVQSGMTPFCMAGCSDVKVILNILKGYGYKLEKIFCEEKV
jgi:uncharacterized protein YbaP (TraB family)